MAAGLSLKAENLPAFTKRIITTTETMLSSKHLEEPSLEIDTWLMLPDLTSELVSALESLAPFGPGNPKPVFASHDLHLNSVASIGRNKEHLKMTVADEAGNKQSVLWWNGGGEQLPEDKFDLAYTLRAADWRGDLQIQMDLVDFRGLTGNGVEIKARKPEIIDYRQEKDPRSLLDTLRLQPSTVIWAESDTKAGVGGMDRFQLSRNDHLVIWSIPPSPEELRQALKLVQPRTVSLIAAHPVDEKNDDFMPRLMGLMKFCVNQREGKVSYEELASATGQREITVRRGLAWLIAHGDFCLQREDENELWVTTGKLNQGKVGTGRIWEEIQSLLEESAAYRAHFKKAEKGSLFE